jgi:tRNA ligase
LNRFLQDRQAFDPALHGDSDGLIHEEIDIDPSLDALPMLKSMCDRLVPLLKLEMPSHEELEEALKEAKDYKPSLRKEIKADPIKCRYYAVSAEVNLESFIAGLLESQKLQCDLWKTLQDEDRIEKHPHITILHSKKKPGEDASDKNKKDFDDFWAECRTLSHRQCDFTITVGPRLAWNDRVMTLEVSKLETQEVLGQSSRLHHDDSHRHITIGTKSKDISGYEGKVLMHDLVAGKTHGMQVAEVGVHQFQGRMKGMF